MGPETAVARLWFGVLAGPAAWILQLTVSYPIAQLSCHAGRGHQHVLTLQLIAAGALLVIASGAATAWQALRVSGGAPGDGGHSIDRAHFMAGLGLLAALVFAFLVIATAVPAWVLHACE